MSGHNFIVPGSSWNAIEQKALIWRARFGLEGEPYLDIMGLVEEVLWKKLGLFELEIVERSEMGSAEGFTDPNGSRIILREDVYIGACRGEPRDRFTVAHELGHWDMHTNIMLARAQPEHNVPPYRLSEPQANQFASEILMPARFFTMYDDADTVMWRHGVSFQAANNRLDYLSRKGRLAA